MSATTQPAQRNRRWYQYSLQTLLIVMTLAIVVFGGWPHVWRLIQFHRLKSYVGQDLRELDDEKREAIAGIVADLTDDPQSPTALFFSQSWYVWEYRNGKATRYLLFQGTPIFMIPGVSSAEVVTFNSFGQVVSKESFSTGWRMDIVDAQWERQNIHGFPCIKVSTRPVIGGDWLATQYYAIIGDEVALVRIEDDRGVARDNGGANHRIGPFPPKRSADEWEAAIQSDNTAEVLRTLAWLRDFGWTTSIRDWEENVSDARAMVAVVLSRETFRRALEQHAQSDDDWVRTAAKSALDAINYRAP